MNYDDRDYLRLYDEVEQVDSGCIHYGKSVNSSGYGSFSVVVDGKQKTTGAHRAAYIFAYGSISDDQVVDHLCHDATICAGGPRDSHRKCVNPLHLQATTRVGNVKRDRLSTLWHAYPMIGDGHVENVEGEYVYPDGHAQCNVCRKLWFHYWKTTLKYANSRRTTNEKTRVAREQKRRLRGARQKGVEQTHCTKGHEFTPENTTYGKVNATTGIRRKLCRQCRNEKWRSQHPSPPAKDMCKEGHPLEYSESLKRRVCKNCRLEATRRYRSR
jgi:hypothetical protein